MPRRNPSLPWRLLLGGAVAATVLTLVLSSAMAFTDVADPHPYGAAIQDLSDRGIINGFSDGTFGPDLSVKRQQFAKMIVLTLDLPVSEADVTLFSDVDIGGPSTLYPDNYVAVAAAQGITNGTSPGKYSPFADITRAQVVTMIVRGAQSVSPGTLTPPPAGFDDTLGSFSDVHSGNMRTAEWNGLLNGLVGFGSAWDPWATASRGEVAQMLFRLLGLVTPPTSTTAGSTTTSAGGTTTSTGSTTTTTTGGTTTSSSQPTTTTAPSTTTTTTAPSTTTTLNNGQVAINGFAFTPAGITVSTGTTVVWRNNHGFSHSIVADDLSFSSGLLATGDTFSHTFDQPGVYPYHCGVHPITMKGTITVQ